MFDFAFIILSKFITFSDEDLDPLLSKLKQQINHQTNNKSSME